MEINHTPVEAHVIKTVNKMGFEPDFDFLPKYKSKLSPDAQRVFQTWTPDQQADAISISDLPIAELKENHFAVVYEFSEEIPAGHPEEARVVS